MFIGELGPDGRLRPVPGVLPAVRAAQRAGRSRVVVPGGSAAEAMLVTGIEVIAVSSLRALAIRYGADLEPVDVGPVPGPPVQRERRAHADLADVVGNEEGVEALITAAASGHHLLLQGPPGAGKTMLFTVLDPRGVLDAAIVNSFPRWSYRWKLPQAHLIGDDLRGVAQGAAGGSDDYEKLANDAQYRLALATAVLPGGRGGIFIGEYAYETGRGFDTIAAEERFRATADASAWGWTDVSDGSDYDQALLRIREYVKRSGIG